MSYVPLGCFVPFLISKNIHACNHLTQERGLQLSGKFDIDEETKYSSVCPHNRFDDTFYEEEEDILLDGCNNLTFGDSSASDGKKSASTGKVYEESWVWLSSSLVVVSRRIIGDIAIFLSSRVTACLHGITQL